MESTVQRKLFRQAALDRQASLEQLDRLVTVADSHGWLASLSIAGLLLFLLVWSVFGTIPIYVKGPGILMSPTEPASQSIESVDAELQALVYIPIEQGKKLHPGMAVQIEPVTVKKGQYGTLIGVARQVPQSPTTMPVLQNIVLPGSFTRGELFYAVQVELVKNASTVSGYRWASSNGPPFKLASRTRLNAEVTIMEQRPISLLIAFLRNISGIYP
jgi:HlyD family secretion protein